MGFALLSRPDDGHPLNVWAQLADIEEVDGDLRPRDREFLHSVGKALADHDCATRFCVTLLHSHFPVSKDEALVETLTEDGTIVTEVLPLRTAETDAGIVPRSWMFANACAADGLEELSVLTWSRQGHLPQEPIAARDKNVIADLVGIYRGWGMTDRFGMALAGPAPRAGMIWTEDTDAEGRHLVQTQRAVEEVRNRRPIMTMYTFNRDGSFIITLGCCAQGPSGRGHTGGKHPWGVKY
jgi:hypothetical protein